MNTASAVFQPAGEWTIKANTPTVMPVNCWINVDPSADISEQPASILDANGKLVSSGDFSLEIQAVIDLDDFPEYSGEIICQAIFNPGPSSKSSQYIITSLHVTQTNRRILMSNQIPTIHQGDQIYFNFLTSTDLTGSFSNDQQVFSAISLRDCSMDSAATYWVCRSGLPPQMAVMQNKVNCMIATDVVDGVATFIATQDGKVTGDSLFPNILTSTPMTLQSVQQDVTLTPPSWFFLPFPTGNQSIKAIFSDKTNGKWTSTITATGR